MAEARGPGGDPDAVYRSVGRYAVLGLNALLVPVGLLFVVAGAGSQDPVFPTVLGVLLTVLGLTGAGSLVAPRHGLRADPPPAVAVEGGLALPLRRAQVLLRAVTGVVLGLLGVLLVLVADSAGPRVLGVLVVVGVVGAAALAARAESRLVVGPEGLRVPGGPTRARTVAWRDVVEVAAVRGWQPHLVITAKGPEVLACRLLPQAWPASALVALVEHHRRRARDRAALVDPDAVERFRT